MSTATCAAVVVGNVVTLVTAPTNMKIKPKSITIDNQSAALKTVSFQDSFTPDPYNGAAAPGAVLPARGQYSVGTLLCAVISELELKGREFIGAMQCYVNAADAACIITVDYELE